MLAASMSACSAPNGAANTTANVAATAPREQLPLKLCPFPGPPPNVAEPGYTQLSVTVTDARGTPLRELKQPDFLVTSGSQQVPIVYFHGDSMSAPISIAIVMDGSYSMWTKVVADQTKLEKVWSSIGDVVGRLDPCDEEAVIEVGGASRSYMPPSEREVRVLLPFTTDRTEGLKLLREAIPYGRTPLYDGIHRAFLVLRSAHYPNRALIVVTDGFDDASAIRKSDILEESRTSRVPIYAIGIGKPHVPGEAESGAFLLQPEVDRVDATTLDELARVSSGRAFIVKLVEEDNGEELVKALSQIAAQISADYQIGIVLKVHSAPPTVAVKDRPALIVQSRVVRPSAVGS
jgi:VWFA-related protein